MEHLKTVVSTKALLNAYLREQQPVLGSYNIKRALCKRFNVRRFSDLPDSAAQEALTWARSEVQKLLQLWETHRIACRVADSIMKELMLSDSTLEWNLVNRIRALVQPNMTEEEALIATKSFLEKNDLNLYEFAYAKGGEQKCQG